MPSYCISTTTSATTLKVVVPITGTLSVVDDNGNPYYATTTCPAIVVISESVTSNPAQDFFNGIILLFAFLVFIVWYFIHRFKLS